MNLHLIAERNSRLSPVQQVLYNRGVPLNELDQYMRPSLNQVAHWSLLRNLTTAVEVFIEILLNHSSRILIQVDCDVDGYTSAALLYNFLLLNFPTDLVGRIDYQVHDDKVHGLTITEDILNKHYDLIFVPDAGSNQNEDFKKLHDLGIQIIVLDHHEVEEETTDAIIVNNQSSPLYENKALSGVGVVWQFCRCLGDTYKVVHPANEFLDLVALGLCADMMDMRQLETRALIMEGVYQMQYNLKKCNPFIKALLEKQAYSIGSTITPMSITFYIAPLINAVTRVGTHEERLRVFEAFLIDKAKVSVKSTKRGAAADATETICEQAARNVTNIKNRQKKISDQAVSEYKLMLTSDWTPLNSLVIIDTYGKLNKNLNGLVANQLLGAFHRPAIVGTVYEAEDGSERFAGSARGIDSSVCPDFRQFVLDSGLVDFAQGHPSAFGISLPLENLPKLIEYTNEHLHYTDSIAEYFVDFLIDGTTSTDIDEVVVSLGNYPELWSGSNGVPEPLVGLQNFQISKSQLMLMSPDKNPTLKIKMKNGNTALIKFHMSKEAFNEIAPNDYTDAIIDAVGTCTINEWNGNLTPQILLKDFEVKKHIINF